MKVLITGSAEFLGSHSAARFADSVHRYDIHCVATASRYFPTDPLELLRSDQLCYDLVIHCPAVSPHRAAIDGRPMAVGAENLALDAALFDWAARTRPGRVVYFSSSAAYPVHMQDGWPRFLLEEADITS
ncbi:MAG: NAD-dependent epimerase/dehydratase family protein [Actinoallomurus sp.]